MTAFASKERVVETSVTTGTGTYTLDGAFTGYQAFSAIGVNNTCPYGATDNVNWEVGIGTVLAAPARLERTAVIASSNGGAAVNWGAGTRTLVCGWPAWIALPRTATKSIAGTGDVTLTALEQRVHALELTGALTGNRNVIIDDTPWFWAVYNNTSGAFTVTVKTAAGTGKLVPRGTRALLYCDGVNVEAVGQEIADTLFRIVDDADPTKKLALELGGLMTATTRTLTVPDGSGTLPLLEFAQTYTKGQRGAVAALTDDVTITPDFDTSNNFSVTLAGNRTLANPTNAVAGQSGIIEITQDATGTRTLAYGANWKFPGGTVPVLSTAANAVDVLVYYALSATRIYGSLIKDVR